jgi:hypothetical protein
MSATEAEMSATEAPKAIGWPKVDWIAEIRRCRICCFCEKWTCWRKAVYLEEHRGTVALHTGGRANQVDSIFEASTEPWSAPLMLHHDENNSNSSSSRRQPQKTARDYHLIVAANGMNCAIRKTYGGHLCRSLNLTGTTALPSPFEFPNTYNTKTNNSSDSNLHSWNVTGQAEATLTQDRQYTVFRGNSHCSLQDLGEGVDKKSFSNVGRRTKHAICHGPHAVSQTRRQTRRIASLVHYHQ